MFCLKCCCYSKAIPTNRTGITIIILYVLRKFLKQKPISFPKPITLFCCSNTIPFLVRSLYLSLLLCFCPLHIAQCSNSTVACVYCCFYWFHGISFHGRFRNVCACLFIYIYFAVLLAAKIQMFDLFLNWFFRSQFSGSTHMFRVLKKVKQSNVACDVAPARTNVFKFEIMTRSATNNLKISNKKRMKIIQICSFDWK